MKCITTILTLVLFVLSASANNDSTQKDEGLEKDSLKKLEVSALDTVPQFSDSVLDARLKAIEKTIPLGFSVASKGFIDYFTRRNRSYSRLMLSRGPYYFALFEPILKKYDMPEELKYLAIVESGLNPKAASWASAVGLWQFIPSTGRMYGLNEDDYVDDRMDPIKSTEAACKYLKSLYNMFDDWELALAAYNCGPGNVRRAIRRSGYQKDFWGVYRHLPRETRSYVPQFVAISYLFNYAYEHNLCAPHHYVPPRVDTVMVDRFINLEILAPELGLCKEDIAKLNPSLKKETVPHNRGYFPLVLPQHVLSNFYENYDSLMTLASKYSEVSELTYQPKFKDSDESKKKNLRYIYKVIYGDYLGKIASSYNVSISEIRAWNNLKSNTIHTGQTLVLYIDADLYKKKILSNSSSNSRKEQDTGKKEDFYIVQPGDSLWLISKKYNNLSIQDIKRLNDLNDNNIKPGMKLKLG